MLDIYSQVLFRCLSVWLPFLSRDIKWDLKGSFRCQCAPWLCLPTYGNGRYSDLIPGWPISFSNSSAHLGKSTTFFHAAKFFDSILYFFGSSSQDLWIWWKLHSFHILPISDNHKSFRYLSDSLNSGYRLELSPTMYLPYPRCWLYKQNSSGWII